MRLVDAMRQRRSVRGFLDRPVPREILENILELASHASSNCNVQPWKVYIATGALRDQLQEKMLARAEAGVPGNPDFESTPEFTGIGQCGDQEQGGKMSFKPVILIYDIDNRLVDELAAEVGASGLYTTINTYNEANAMDAVRQYNRCFGLMTNKLSCVITGWNNHKKPRDQFLYHLRELERRSPLRSPTPVIIVTEDHRADLKGRALDPKQGNVSAYLHRDRFRDTLATVLKDIVYRDRRTAEDRNVLPVGAMGSGSRKQEENARR